MAQLTINQCQNCGKILAPGVTKCGKCHTEHSIAPAVVNPLRFSAAEAAEYKAQFQEQVEACPKDSNALFAMGLTYLGLKNYELADEHFVKAVHLTPSNPDIYYYTALSMFHHRSVMNLRKTEMDRIEEWLDTAVQMQPKRKYLILQMILRQGMSSMGLNVDTDKAAPAELMVQARQTTQEEDELYEIEQHVLLTDEKTNRLLESLTKTKTEEDDGSATLDEALEEYDDFCELPREDDGEFDVERMKRLDSVEERERFLKHLEEPEKPTKDSLPTYLEPLFKIPMRLVKAVVLFVVLAIVSTALGWFGPHELGITKPEDKLAKYEEYVKLDKKQRKEKLEQYTQTYQEERAEEDSIIANNTFFYLIYRTEADNSFHTDLRLFTNEELKEPVANSLYFGMAHGWKGWVGLLIFLFPWLYFLGRTYITFSDTKSKRAITRANNSARQNEYDRNLQAYKTRPTVDEYKTFCALYAGPNGVSVVGDEGDFVEIALQQAKISEQDIKNGNGRIFMACYMFDLTQMGVQISVAMRDSIVDLYGRWDTDTDEISFTQRNILYNNIASFDLEDEQLDIISHSNNVLDSIVFAHEGYATIFKYQDEDPTDEQTYSNTRTTDINEFHRSLIKMHTAFTKS